jgi:hypothetical protein
VTKNVLDSDKRRVIALQTDLVHREHFFLAGGTGLGVRLGHRVSRDILLGRRPRPSDFTLLCSQ